MSESKEVNSSNTRWWESYLVRYLSGSIVGAFCIIAIIISIFHNSSINYETIKNILPSDGKDFPVVGVLILLLVSGLVYSYVISSPITVYHYGRGGSQKIEKLSRYMWLGWSWAILTSILPEINYLSIWVLCFLPILIYSIILSIIKLNKIKWIVSEYRQIPKNIYHSIKKPSLFFTILYCNISSMCMIRVLELYKSTFEGKAENFSTSLLLLSIPTFFVGIMQYITLFRILHAEDKIHLFYRKLIKSRALKGAKDVRETYSHLREHSNSTFIVVLEISFTCLILFFINLSKLNNNNSINFDINKFLFYGIGFFLFWSIPNIFMWSRANNLEKDYLENSEHYLQKET